MNTLLLRFVVSASLARLPNEGLALALVLIATERTGSTAQAGVLVAASTFPQLVTGPLLGPVLDRSPRPWALLRVAGAVTAVAVVLLATTLGRAPLLVPALGALALSSVEPLLNGGASAIGDRGAWSDRVFAWDSLAYNIAGLGGPAAVTVVAVVASPAWALAVLGLGCAAVTVTSLGLDVAERPARATPLPGRRSIAAAVRVMVTDVPLRSATLATTLAFAALGGLAFALVAATEAAGHRRADAGIAMTVSAVGGLVGSVVMTRRRSPAHPERAVLACVATTGGLLLGMAAGPWSALLAGSFLIGVVDAPLLVGLFATRSDHSPPELRATVFTLGASAKLGVASLGALVAGLLLDGRATGTGLAVIGAIHLLAAAVGWLCLRSGAAPVSGMPDGGTAATRRALTGTRGTAAATRPAEPGGPAAPDREGTAMSTTPFPRRARVALFAAAAGFGGTMALELDRAGTDLACVVGFHSGLGTVAPADSGAITARVLVNIGTEDPIIPPDQRAAFEQEMRAAGADWRMVLYGGAVHSFTNPAADGSNPAIAYDALADARSWRAMLDLFGEVF